MEITVFTPTYNRAYTIGRLYESLKQQTFKEFEWIVIDDGSTDGTMHLFSDIINDYHEFNIIYKRNENGGKHRAVNKGISLASGRLFFIVDSDDYLPSDSLETIVRYEKTIAKESKGHYAGVVGLRGNINGNLIGKTFKGDILDITYLETSAHNIYGDKAEVYYTDLLKKYPFPEFENEKFLPESVVWNVIAEDGYKLRYFNKITYYCEYLEGGLTSQGDEKFQTIPKGYGLYIYQMIKYGKLKKIKKWDTVLKYYRLFNGTLSFFDIAKNLHIKPISLYFRLLGMRIYYKIYNN